MDPERAKLLVNAKYKQRLAEFKQNLSREAEKEKARARHLGATHNLQEEASLALARQLDAEEHAMAGVEVAGSTSTSNTSIRRTPTSKIEQSDEEFTRQLQMRYDERARVTSQNRLSGPNRKSHGGETNWNNVIVMGEANPVSQDTTSIVSGRGALRFAVPTKEKSKRTFSKSPVRTPTSTNPNPDVGQSHDSEGNHDAQPRKKSKYESFKDIAARRTGPNQDSRQAHGPDPLLSQARILTDCLLPHKDIREINKILDAIQGKSPGVTTTRTINAMEKDRTRLKEYFGSSIKQQIDYISDKFNNWHAKVTTKPPYTGPKGIDYGSDEEAYNALPKACRKKGCDVECPPIKKPSFGQLPIKSGTSLESVDSVDLLDTSDFDESDDDDDDDDSDAELIEEDMNDFFAGRTPSPSQVSIPLSVKLKMARKLTESTVMQDKSARVPKSSETDLRKNPTGLKIKLRGLEPSQALPQKSDRASSPATARKPSFKNLTFGEFTLPDLSVELVSKRPEPPSIEAIRERSKNLLKKKERSDNLSPPTSSYERAIGSFVEDVGRQLPKPEFPFDLSSKIEAKAASELKRKRLGSVPAIVLPECDELSTSGSKRKSPSSASPPAQSLSERLHAKVQEDQSVKTWWKSRDQDSKTTAEMTNAAPSEAVTHEQRDSSPPAPVPQEFMYEGSVSPMHEEQEQEPEDEEMDPEDMVPSPDSV